MRAWLKKIALPFWVGVQLFGFRGFSGFIFFPLTALYGVWFAALIVFIFHGIWGTVFYLLLMRSSAFDRARAYVAEVTKDKKKGLLAWVRRKVVEQQVEDKVLFSPLWLMVIFIVESPLTGVLAIRLDYPPKLWRKAIAWIWVGAAAEVLTWFVPIYGGGVGLGRLLFASLFGG